ncbi:hypothetical protein MUL_0313 [Mycobacterium ulcerans Agy99]|uniref:Uncharacterized protein n=1 Tax=Mycobacterium ulcerans (strain Agy99) TaxID=362242 RepID=A0PL24_MYCUA|nr:hypothetical protein MUL_0313 [Mycobacterium ulcerans Agy99]
MIGGAEIQYQAVGRLGDSGVAHADLSVDGPLHRPRIAKSQQGAHGKRDRDRPCQGAHHFSGVHVRIIFREFMEVRQAPKLLRRLTDAWVILIGISLFGSYAVGLALG